jgi:hypothetical protein
MENAEMKPRLAESGPALWAAIKELNITGVVPPGGGVYYPAIRIVAGPTFVMDADNNPKITASTPIVCASRLPSKTSVKPTKS